MKYAFASYEMMNDTFTFEKSFETVSNQIKTERIEFTGEQLFALRDKKMVELTDDELAVGILYLKHFNEEPADLFEKSLEI